MSEPLSTPAGWKLVPAAPTTSQKDAGGAVCGSRDIAHEVYHQMLSASPSPEALPASGVEFMGDLRRRSNAADDECRADDADVMRSAADMIDRLDEAAIEANALYHKVSAERAALRAALEAAKRRFKEIATGAAYKPAMHAGAGVVEIDAALPSAPAPEDR